MAIEEALDISIPFNMVLKSRLILYSICPYLLQELRLF